MPPPNFRRCKTFIGIVLVVGCAGASHVTAAPAGDQRRQAARLQAQLAAGAERIAAADRRLREAQRKERQTTFELSRAEDQLRTNNAWVALAQARLKKSAVDAYVHALRASFVEQFSGSGRDLGIRQQYLEQAAGDDRRAIDRLRAARQDLVASRSHLAEARRLNAVAATRLRNERSALKRSEGNERAALNRVNGQLVALVAAEQARKDSVAIRRAGAPHPKAPGGVWACIRQLESSNNYRAHGGGAYQIQPATWRSLGGAGTAEDAPAGQQDAMAITLQRVRGWSQWTTANRCGVSR